MPGRASNQQFYPKQDYITASYTIQYRVSVAQQFGATTDSNNDNTNVN